ncbi:hypothetical protein Psi02_72560 [Planotetraspora silvatica]|uniref:Uncharacterized protein n=1 Tax=Planotetraspora silvatica TaxID=234614 RepID=A0A8J3UVY5_9ACTN|nr:hypothetical protein [Planotetraspora silvatica]GII50832.1 hypothetical protein Psi02_72560 [Planotetraspora silvatica]
MITDAYETLKQHQSTAVGVIEAAKDAFTVIAASMELAEETRPPELHASYALLHQEAVDGLAALSPRANAVIPTADRAVDVPELEKISSLGGLLCEVLLTAAEHHTDVNQRLALLNAAAHAAQIRDLLAP